MKLGDVLSEDRVLIGGSPETLEGALEALLARFPRLEGDKALLATDVTTASGEGMVVVRAGADVILVGAGEASVETLQAGLAAFDAPFSVASREAEGGGEEGSARILILLLTPRRTHSLRAQILPALSRTLRGPKTLARLLAAHSADEIRGIDALFNAELHGQMLVEDILEPVSYRVYPETPLAEVVALMVRRGLHAVPVVGEKYEVLGILTAGDALRLLLPERLSAEPAAEDAMEVPGRSAREVMTRSVMCVSEGQSVLEAANLMVNRNVAQLPVVRGGELVGFVTRDAVLGQLLAR